MKMRTWMIVVAAWMALAGAASAEPDSKRMERAKDYIAEEQWSRAIVELQAVADDPREANRDEALFWLAHSEHEMGDHPAAIQTHRAAGAPVPEEPMGASRPLAPRRNRAAAQARGRAVGGRDAAAAASGAAAAGARPRRGRRRRGWRGAARTAARARSR